MVPVLRDTKDDTDGKKIGAKKCHLMRVNMENAPEFKMPFFGRVISHSVAANSNPALCFALGDNNGAGPALYLDISKNLNPSVSTFSPAGLVTQVPSSAAADTKLLEDKEFDTLCKQQGTQTNKTSRTNLIHNATHAITQTLQQHM